MTTTPKTPTATETETPTAAEPECSAWKKDVVEKMAAWKKRQQELAKAPK